MKNSDPVPLENTDNQSENLNECDLTRSKDESEKISEKVEVKKKKENGNKDKKKKKRNLWPIKAMIITLILSFAVNAASELVLNDSQMWLAIVLTCIILAFGVLFDMIGTSATSCDVEPFLSMASRKVKGAKTAVKLSKKSDIVSSVCCDIVGDICGIVSGVCAATIATYFLGSPSSFIIKVAIYAVISTATISFKAVGKGYAVNNANKIIFTVAKILSVFNKNG